MQENSKKRGFRSSFADCPANYMSDSRYRNYNIEINIGLVSCDGAWYRKDRDGSYLSVAVMSCGFDCWIAIGGIFL